jgi:signal transduction histidine kinase
VVDSLNDLLQRLDHALESEQRFTANAAHELMTPLAAIKTEVQLCQRRLRGTDSADMLQRIAARVDRASHTVEQLLTLARVDPDTPMPTANVALGRLLADTVAENAHLALERNLDVQLEDPEAVEIEGSSESLAILLRNLLINAFRYATPGSTVTVALRRSGGAAAIEICNDCSPLSRAEFARLEERFYRVPGSEGLGAGLGLSIVRRIADQHGASFRAAPREDGGGFCALLTFPD